jgi:uncharacterized protein (TIGR02147 family)
MPISVFDFQDYRTFLSEAFAERKKLNGGFSFRGISQKIGIKSSGFLSSVLQGKRGIGDRTAIELAKILRLGSGEREYFMNLIKYNQAQAHEERKFYLEKCISIRKRHTQINMVEIDQYEFYEKWYYAAIREVIGILNVTDDDAALVGRGLRPAITPEEVRRAFVVLLRLGMIKKNEQGVYEKAESLINSGVPTNPTALHNFQLAMMDLAHGCFDRFPKEDRDISSLTLSIDSLVLDMAQRMVENLRKNLLELSRSVKNPDRVIQMNFQIFPLFRADRQEESA